jgi:triosephosphate isomerase
MVIVINFKNYKIGKEVVKLAKTVQNYFGKSDEVILAVPGTDLSRVGDAVELDLFAQHVDSVLEPRSTGGIGVDQVKAVGALGTLVNHSERRLAWKEVNKVLAQCQEQGFRSIVCVKTYREAKWVLGQSVKPWAIAYEDTKLIGTSKSITKYRQKELKSFVELVKGVEGTVSKTLGRLNPWKGADEAGAVLAFCGAGIHSARDVKIAREIGCDGVLISSAIAKAKKPDKLLRELAGLGGGG